MTFASRQRPGIFDARQRCVKDNVKFAPTPLIRLSKTVVQLCYTFDANQRSSPPNSRAVFDRTVVSATVTIQLGFSHGQKYPCKFENKITFSKLIFSMQDNKVYWRSSKTLIYS